MDGQLLLQWVTPVILFGFATMFAVVWRLERRFVSAGVIGASYATAGLAFVLELVFSRVDGAAPALFVEDLLYLAGGALFASGVAMRAGCRPPVRAFAAVVAAAFAVSVACGLHGLDVARTQGMSFAMAGLFGSPLWLCRGHWRRPADRVLAALIVFLSGSVALSGALLVEDVRAEGLAYEQGLFSAAVSAIMNVSSTAVALTLLTAYALEMVGRFRTASHHDPLTGLLNRRGFEPRAEVLVRTGLDTNEARGVVLVADLDRFKSVNDRFGHAVGDRVIRTLAATLRAGLPEDAPIARLGGEEFCAVLSRADMGVARMLAEGVRVALPAMPGLPAPVTASFGLAPFTRDYATTFALADAALYEAKAAGRDRVMCRYGDEAGRVGPAARAGSKLAS